MQGPAARAARTESESNPAANIAECWRVAAGTGGVILHRMAKDPGRASNTGRGPPEFVHVVESNASEVRVAWRQAGRLGDKRANRHIEFRSLQCPRAMGVKRDFVDHELLAVDVETDQVDRAATLAIGKVEAMRRAHLDAKIEGQETTLALDDDWHHNSRHQTLPDPAADIAVMPGPWTTWAEDLKILALLFARMP